MKTHFKLKNKNKKIKVMPFSDIHYGSPSCNVDYFEFMLDKFKKIKGDKIGYLLGDECDVAVKRQGNSTYHQKIDVNEQIEYIIQSFKPVRKYLHGIVKSNHMDRVSKEFNLDISKIIAEALEIPYGNNIYETIKINGNPYTIYAVHGSKTSNQLHLMQGAAQRQTDHIEANLFLTGHAHYTNAWSLPKLTSNGYTRRHYVLCGHMLNYKHSYAEQMNLKPNPCGFTKINIDGDLRTTVEIYNEDECQDYKKMLL